MSSREQATEQAAPRLIDRRKTARKVVARILRVWLVLAIPLAGVAYEGERLRIATLAGQSPPPPAHCRLVRVDQGLQGTCGKFLGQQPTLSIAQVRTLESGRYRDDVQPLELYAGELRTPAGAVPVEIEFYAPDTGILRPRGLEWVAMSKVSRSADGLAFDLQPGAVVPPSDLDRAIIARAAAILHAETVWDRADDRHCGADDKTWSIYCALERATVEVTGGFHHRRPALQAVRLVVQGRTEGRGYSHRLMDYNNDRTTRLADVQSLFAEALVRLK